jgi:hypothetical protein
LTLSREIGTTKIELFTGQPSTWAAAPLKQSFFSQGSAMKLTFAIAVVGLVLIAGTTTICMSGAVTDRTMEYGFARATVGHWLNPHAATCR